MASSRQLEPYIIVGAVVGGCSAAANCGSRGILDPEKLKNATLQQVNTSLAIAIDNLARYRVCVRR